MRRQWFCGLALLWAAAGMAAELATPAIEGVVAAGTPIEVLREGLEGTEGPLRFTDGTLLFTENRVGRILRVAADGTLSEFLAGSQTNGSNSLALNARNELVSVQTVRPAVGIVYPAGSVKTLVAGYQGKPFNRPNDLVIDRSGGIYFTDPGNLPKPGEPQAATAIYYLSPAGELKRLISDIAFPNGIQLSTDERTLYVANTAGEYVLAYDVPAAGVVTNGRNFARLAVQNTGGGAMMGADGLAIDSAGRLYAATAAGVQVFSAAGDALGVIELPKAPQNLAFAGLDRRQLYIVGRGSVYRIAMLAEGFSGRAK
ncbi:MAG: SMP-30/gluconolactonase/LRE family protein [Steroidobacteraceae bacterium]